MSCTACGTVNPVGRKFCGECGARLALACASCSAPLDQGQKFCGECGASAPDVAQGGGPASAHDAATTGRSAVVAERRLVSVLFADLVGFTPFSADRDAEEVRETLTRYFDLARTAIGRHGGTIEKFIGDAVMAVWGTPTAREDDAERAVRAALELLDAIRGLGPGISARAGVLTGEAAVTLGATDQGMVAGDLVNTAARLQSVAAPGTVLVGEATYRAASAAIAFEAAGDHDLKGKAAPVAAWRALRVVAERGGRGRAELLEAPFVGRDEELRMLKELFHGTSREGRARLVSVTGPAGIGKSRLAWEFEKYLDGLVEPVWWHHGRSPSYGQGVTFWALGEMVRTRCGLAETSDETTTREHVAEMLARHLPDPGERAWVEPAILALLGLEAAPVAAGELFARWRLLFERLTATGTVVMVFEDLHWADAGTLDFIDHLLDWSKSIPLLIVTLARPELLVQRPDWGAGRRSFVAVPLDPLPEPAMRALLAGLVPELPEDALRRIVARAEGIPLYAVETVRMLVAEGRLVQRGSAYAPAGDISALAVPETLTALIAARLDTLDTRDRSLVLDAAVLGLRFTVEGLAAVSGQDPATLEPRLRGLVRRELFNLEADPRSPERGQYGFVQALIREVAYNTLARRDRKERHLAAARFFESLGSDELAGALAGHYLAAHANATEGPEADALAAQARVALRGAAERAMTLGSSGQAVDLLGQAITVTGNAGDRAELHERLGIAGISSARYVEAQAAFESALAYHAERGDRPAAARLTRELGECALYAGRYSDGRDLLEIGVAEYADLGPTHEMTAMRGQLARGLYFLGENRRAIAIADEVLEVAEHEDLIPILADTLITKGTTLTNLGRAREGVGLIAVGERLAEEHELVHTRMRGLNNRAVSTTEFDPPSAFAATVEGLALARRMGADVWARGFVGNLGFMAFRMGEWDLGARELRAAVEERFEASDAALVLNNLISILAARGEPYAPSVAQIEALKDDLDADQYEALYHDTLGLVALADGRFVDAAREWRASAEATPRMEPPSRLMAARAFLWAGDADAASVELDRLAELHLGFPAWVANRRSIGAGIAHLRGEPDQVPTFKAARRRLLDLSLRWDAALVALDAGYAIGAGDTAVAAELADARAFLASVGATPVISLIDGLLLAAMPGAAVEPPHAAGELAAS